MILQFLLEPLFLLAEFLVKLFPTFPRFNNLAVSLNPIAYVIRFLNMFVSLQAVSRCLIAILVVYNIKFGWSILMWVIRKISGVS